MGACLTAANLSSIVENKSASGFNCGLAEINGWRKKMEDSHVIHIRPDWAFFGVFDGHGGDQCSAFVAKEFYERLERDGCPKDDAAVKALVLDIDQKYLDTGTPSGSTGAMCIVHRPTTPGGKIRLRVINVGDSRVLLGKRDGTIVDGGGTCTDQGLTTDHKPNHPSESERIYRCGGKVETAEGGVARVNGDLAVSRGFGDAEYKKTGPAGVENPGPEDRPVTADPELGEFECDESDVLIIVCDGVSEGDFSNPEVTKLISESLEKDGDPGEAARKTVLHAEIKNSKDNVTCMVILFDGENKEEECREVKVFTPGPLPAGEKKCNKDFLENYEVMAKRADLTVERAIEMRYDLIKKLLAEDPERLSAHEAFLNGQTLQSELEVFAPGPEGAIQGEARSGWFTEWCKDKMTASGGGAGGGSSQEQMLMQLMQSGGIPGLPPSMLQQLMGGLGGGGSQAEPEDYDGRRVMAADAEKLEAAVKEHNVSWPGRLKWDARIKDVANKEGVVIKEDPADTTMQVKFDSVKMWLPTCVLTVLDSETEGTAGAGGYEGGSASAGS